MRPLLAACLLMIVAIPSALSRSYDDPVAYCRAVGTIDKPAAPYAGPKLPGWMATALDLQPDQGDRMEWRCARGSVLACLYGANIPCAAKAVTRRRPTGRSPASAATIPMRHSCRWSSPGTRRSCHGPAALPGQW